MKAHRLPAGRDVPTGELRALLDACDDGTPAGARDAAVVAVLAGARAAPGRAGRA